MKINPRIITLLIIPLSIFALLSLWTSGLFSGKYTYRDVFLNLGTDVIGILFSLVFVDAIIAINSRLEWKSAEIFIRKSIVNTVIDLVNNLDKSLGSKVTKGVMKDAIRKSLGSPSQSHASQSQNGLSPNDVPILIMFYETCTYTDFDLIFRELSIPQILALTRNLDEMSNETNRLIDTFISKLPPEFVKLILAIQECVFDFRRELEVVEREQIVESLRKYHQQDSDNLYQQNSDEFPVFEYSIHSKRKLSKIIYRIIKMNLQLYRLSMNEKIQLTYD